MILLRLIPAETLQACAVCFADDGSGIVDGIKWGIILMLLVTAAMVSGIFLVVARIENARQD